MPLHNDYQMIICSSALIIFTMTVNFIVIAIIRTVLIKFKRLSLKKHAISLECTYNIIYIIMPPLARAHASGHCERV